MSDLATEIIGIIPETQVVYLENYSTVPFKGMYASNPYHIAPGQRGIVPYFAMCLWLGDPRSVDVDDTHRYRHAEVERLRVKYGAYDDMAVWEQNKPKLRAFDLNNAPIRTVVDDPEGAHLQTKGVNVAQQQALQQAMAAMQAQVARLELELARVSAEPTHILNIDNVSTEEKQVQPEMAPQVPPAMGDMVSTPDTAAAALAAHAAQALADQIASGQAEGQGPSEPPVSPASIQPPIAPQVPREQSEAEARAEVVEDSPGVITITG